MTPDPPTDAHSLALTALAATLTDERRARRFLDLTGIGTEDLRRTADDPSLLSALLMFLEGHEPDLVSVSQQIGVKPEALIRARQRLDSSEDRE